MVEWKANRNQLALKNKNNTDEQLTIEDQRLKKFLEISILCNNANINGNNNDDINSPSHNGEGDPLELALLKFARAFDKQYFEKYKSHKRLDEEPFDSEDMVMGTMHEMDGKVLLYCKGAPEAIIDRCNGSLTKNGRQAFGEEERKNWKQRNDKLSEDGLRVIAFAFKEFNEYPEGEPDVEKDFMHELTFLSLTGFIDPPREDVKEAIKTCRKAGIKVEMVTGDHPGTARNIALQVNVAEEGNDTTIHGSELGEGVDGRNREEVVGARIFARVDPGQKLDLIRYHQENGDIVAMTGDGINDAPALKKADIGIAMGKRGTQVAREVSDMVLKDDTFSSIVEAVREGRIILGNIRKFIIYQLSYHLSEILIIAVVSFTVFSLPLLPLQLLFFLNLLSDVFPALALGIGKGNANIMEHSPKNPKEPIISSENWFTIGLYGLILTVFTTAAYFFALYYWDLSLETCNNVAFFGLAFAQLWHVFNMREADESIFLNQVTRNKYVWAALGFCIIVIIAAYLFPATSQVLSFHALEPKVWLLIGISSILPLITIQALEELRQKKMKLKWRFSNIKLEKEDTCRILMPRLRKVPIAMMNCNTSELF